MRLTNESGEEYEVVGTDGIVPTDASLKTLQEGYLFVKPIKKDWPQEGDKYWLINDTGVVEETNWRHTEAHILGKEFGNYWRTEEEAEAVAKIYKEINRVVRDGSWEWSSVVDLIKEAQNIVKESK